LQASMRDTGTIGVASKWAAYSFSVQC